MRRWFPDKAPGREKRHEKEAGARETRRRVTMVHPNGVTYAYPKIQNSPFAAVVVFGAEPFVVSETAFVDGGVSSTVMLPREDVRV